MKATGPTKLSTRMLARKLRKTGSQRKQKMWIDLAKRILGRRRTRPEVNLSKISLLAMKNKDKILIVPGKVLGRGELKGKARVTALSFSDKAKKEINATGKAFTFDELIESKAKPSEMTIIK